MKKFITIAAMSAFAVLGTVNVSEAATVAELQAMIAQLQAQLNGSTTTSGSMLSAHNGVNLKVGSYGTRVSELQACMNTAGYNTGVVDGKFGPNTAAGVKAFQASKGLAVDGIVGAQTTPAFQAACPVVTVEVEEEDDKDSDVSDFDTNNGDEADFSDFDLDDADDDTIVEGEEEVEIAEYVFELEDEGAALLERMDIVLTFSGADDGDELDAWEVFNNLYVMVDGDVIAEVEADDEDEWEDVTVDGTSYDEARLRISGINEVFEADDEHTITLAADIAGSVDLGTDDESEWTVRVADTGLRFVDEAGITLYLAEEAGSDSDTATFTIEEEGQDDELDVQPSNDDPESTTLKVEDDKSSDDITVFIFELEADDESSDIELEDIDLTVNTGTEDYEDVVKDAYLLIDGEEFDDLTVTNGNSQAATLSFDIDKDFTVKSGKTVDVELVLEFKAANGTNYSSGETVQAEVDGSDVSGEGADDLTAGGSATGEVHTLADTGLIETYVSKSSASEELGDDTIAVLTFEFELEAFEDTFYINEDGSDFGVTLTAGTVISTTIAETTADLTTDDSYEINDGESETFTVEIQVASSAAAGTAQSVRATIDDVDYNTDSDLGGTSATVLLGAPDYKSTSVSVIDAA